MTVIAYKDGILAADTLATSNGTRISHVFKIKRVNGWMIGGAGTFGLLIPLTQWVEAGADFNEPVNFSKIENCDCILISPEGKIHYCHPNVGYVLEEDAPFMGMGSGGDIARGVLYYGGTAIEAVEAGIALEIGCGGDVVWMDIDGNEYLKLPKEIYNPGNFG